MDKNRKTDKKIEKNRKKRYVQTINIEGQTTRNQTANDGRASEKIII